MLTRFLKMWCFIRFILIDAIDSLTCFGDLTIAAASASSMLLGWLFVDESCMKLTLLPLLIFESVFGDSWLGTAASASVVAGSSLTASFCSGYD